MQLIDILVIAVIVIILGFAVGYIIKEKKRGKKCIGCPYACSCASKSQCNSNAKEDKG